MLIYFCSNLVLRLWYRPWFSLAKSINLIGVCIVKMGQLRSASQITSKTPSIWHSRGRSIQAKCIAYSVKIPTVWVSISMYLLLTHTVPYLLTLILYYLFTLTCLHLLVLVVLLTLHLIQCTHHVVELFPERSKVYKTYLHC